MTFSGTAGYNLEFLLHFSASLKWQKNHLHILIPYGYGDQFLGNESTRDTNSVNWIQVWMHLRVWLFLPLLKHFRIRSYDVKAPQSFWSGGLLHKTDKFFWTCNFFLLSLYMVIISWFF